jgi:hypothetical protein
MKTNYVAPYALAACVALGILNACHRHQASTRILFIGNSYTFCNGGIDKQLERLTPACKTECLALGGYTLEKHWNEGQALQAIRRGGWNYVVLQEQSQGPVINRTRFFDAARRFDSEIRRAGAKTVLLMTWERPDSVRYGVTTSNLASAYTSLGAELGAKVAPAGLACARALAGMPGLALYIQDGHPTAEGTYLAACVLYGTLFEQSPVENPRSDQRIPDDKKAYLQQIASESLCSCQVSQAHSAP